MTTDDELRRAQEAARASLRAKAPAAIEALREIARNGETPKRRASALRDLERRGYTLDDPQTPGAE